MVGFIDVVDVKMAKQQKRMREKGLPKCLSLSSQMFRDTGSRRLRIDKTTINSTAMPIVNNVPVNKAANGKIDKPRPPSIDK